MIGRRKGPVAVLSFSGRLCQNSVFAELVSSVKFVSAFKELVIPKIILDVRANLLKFRP